MNKILLILILITTVCAINFPQANRLSFGISKPVELLDTINVFVDEHFEITDKLKDWSTNFGEITYTLSVYLEMIDNGSRRISFERINGGFEYYRGNLSYFNSRGIELKSNVERGLNPGDYDVQLSSEISSAGVYYFVGIICPEKEWINFQIITLEFSRTTRKFIRVWVHT
jgi:hypothetical protein